MGDGKSSSHVSSSKKKKQRDVEKFREICALARIDFEANEEKFTSELRKSRREKLLDIYDDVRHLTKAKRAEASSREFVDYTSIR